MSFMFWVNTNSEIATENDLYVQNVWKGLWIVAAVVSTSYSYFWDLKFDWGFLRKDSKYKFLRSELAYKNVKSY